MQSGNALFSINVVTLHSAQLVPGWVTIFEWVKGKGKGTWIHIAP